MLIKIKKLHPDAITPKYAHTWDSGFDLHSLNDYAIYPGETVLVATGLAIDVGNGYEMQIRPRSGLSLKTPLRIANSPGTVDATYKGQIGIIAWNCYPPTLSGKEMFENVIHIKKGDKIAQGVICPVVQGLISIVDDLGDSERGEQGFGSTGV